MSDLIYIMDHLVDKDGRLMIPGIYDDVAKLTIAESQLYEKIDFDMEVGVYAAENASNNRTWSCTSTYAMLTACRTSQAVSKFEWNWCTSIYRLGKTTLQ